MTPILLYLLSGCVALGAALWIVGDLAEGKRIVLTWRMGLLVLAWPAGLLWLIVHYSAFTWIGPLIYGKGLFERRST